jgi:hypothetical protein
MDFSAEGPLTVAKLYLQRHFYTYLVDSDAGVPMGTTDKMIKDLPVPKQDAERVLAVLGSLRGQNYNLNTVQVKILEEGETNEKSST